MSVDFLSRRNFIALSAPALLVACVAPPEPEVISGPELQFGFVPNPDYGQIIDGEYTLPPIPLKYLQGVNRRMNVLYNGEQDEGVIEVDIHAKFLFHVIEDGHAWRYPIAIGRAGRALLRPTVIRRKVEWPGWTPTANMLRTQPEVYGPFARGVPGGLTSPLGSRALYLYEGNRDTYFRIHGTNDLASIGNSGSAGCIRMFNHDIISLFPKIDMGTKVIIRTYEESLRLEGIVMANRGIEMPPTIISAEEIYGATDVVADVLADVIADAI